QHAEGRPVVLRVGDAEARNDRDVGLVEREVPGDPSLAQLICGDHQGRQEEHHRTEYSPPATKMPLPTCRSPFRQPLHVTAEELAIWWPDYGVGPISRPQE